MRILIVSWCFAPYNTVGAVRVTRLAEYLLAAGYDLRVITAANQPFPADLEQAVPAGLVTYSRWIDVNRPAERLAWRLRGRRREATPADGDHLRPGGRSLARRWLHAAASGYQGLVNLPDKRIGWYPFACRAAKQLTAEGWRPDLVYASGPPFTGLLAGAGIARRLGVEWVAELRDPWQGSGYTRSGLQTGAQRWLEQRTLGSAAGIVTLADPVTDLYRARYGKPTVTVYNGFDPAPAPELSSGGRGESDGAVGGGAAAGPPETRLTIVYTGTIYPGKRDPRPLFDALVRLSPPDRAQVSVAFYGPSAETVGALAQAAGVAACVQVRPPLSHLQSLAVQRSADALLLLQWNDPREIYHLPAKLFEYLGALRPIIGLGYDQAVPARMIRARGAGIYDNDPAHLADFLRGLLEEKRRFGRIADLPQSVRAGLARADQLARLVEFIERRDRP